ncbi:hypothetical protein J1N35_021996 [Gossypium stocksii]|uniref:Retrotransposon Copia-like N-terminal domain-containing protein n=1 Tax=Gossypium stocksii TaxID=47602 RepID=A0A9D3VFA4_9ROSI|nr:hypothetical protein J1N35_021996 [Gossypium stocksii]
MATEGIPTVETPRHSTNSGEAVQQPSFGILPSLGFHYFAKHDTIELNEQSFLLWKHQLLLILEGYGLEGFVLGTTLPPPTLIPGTDATPMDFDLVTDMLLNCEAQQLALLTDVPLQANLVSRSQQGEDSELVSPERMTNRSGESRDAWGMLRNKISINCK